MGLDDDLLEVREYVVRGGGAWRWVLVRRYARVRETRPERLTHDLLEAVDGDARVVVEAGHAQVGEVGRVVRPLHEVDVLVDEREDVVEALEGGVERLVARDEVERKEVGIATDESELLQLRECAADDARAAPLGLDEGKRVQVRGDRAH